MTADISVWGSVWLGIGIIATGLAVVFGAAAVADALENRRRRRQQVEEHEADPRLDPDERVLPMRAQVAAEDHLNEMFNLPPVWRCPCGGRPWETESTCPRCGRSREERW